LNLLLFLVRCYCSIRLILFGESDFEIKARQSLIWNIKAILEYIYIYYYIWPIEVAFCLLSVALFWGDRFPKHVSNIHGSKLSGRVYRLINQLKDKKQLNMLNVHPFGKRWFFHDYSPVYGRSLVIDGLSMIVNLSYLVRWMTKLRGKQNPVWLTGCKIQNHRMIRSQRGLGMRCVWQVGDSHKRWRHVEEKDDGADVSRNPLIYHHVIIVFPMKITKVASSPMDPIPCM